MYKFVWDISSKHENSMNPQSRLDCDLWEKLIVVVVFLGRVHILYLSLSAKKKTGFLSPLPLQ